MALKSVLILTAAFGEGHNAAARNVAAALEARQPSARVEVHDVFHEAYGWLNLRVRDAYLLAINHMPALWKAVFSILDSTSVLGGGIGIFGRAARRLDALVKELEPDVIVSVYPGYGHLLEYLRKKGRSHNAKLATIVTDSLTINSAWYRPYSDALLVANEATARVIESAGVDRARIHVTGFPVPALFDEPTRRPDSGPWQVLYMVNSAHHTAPAIVRGLLGVKGIALTVTTGHDAGLADRIREISAETGVPVEVHGWTPRIPELIRRSHVLISKAGGATVQEALAARTPMIITQVVPGQEEGNARLLIEGGAAAFASTPDEIATEVVHAFANDARVWFHRRDAARALARPGASAAAAECIESLVGS